MAMFVHLAPEAAIGPIRRSGIKVAKSPERQQSGVFAMPVTPNFYVSHQWLRELKRRGQRTIFGVYFRVPDDEVVSVGHYSSTMVDMPAARAAGLIHSQDAGEGYQILVPRRILPAEIHRIRHLPQVIGWRYMPGARERAFCACPVCVSRGEVKSTRKRRSWNMRELGAGYREGLPSFEALKAVIETEDDPEVLRRALYDLAAKRRRAPCDFLQPLATDPSPEVGDALVLALAGFADPLARTLLERLAAGGDRSTAALARRKLAQQ